MTLSTNNSPAPDIATSSDEYALRFSKKVGKWFLDLQAEGVRKLLKPYTPCNILEVGGGHAQLTQSLVTSGHRVVVQGSDILCSERVRRIFPSHEIPFICSALDVLPFGDQQFDIIVTVRTMAHVSDPASFLAECCRVASQAILIDYASLRSLNYFGDMLFELKQKVEKDTRLFRSFSSSLVNSILTALGFELYDSVPQFFWPMALHRFHSSRSLGRYLEAIPRTMGLTRVLGSPILALYRRTKAKEEKHG